MSGLRSPVLRLSVQLGLDVLRALPEPCFPHMVPPVKIHSNRALPTAGQTAPARVTLPALPCPALPPCRCVVWLFAVHPYDVGDTLVINGENHRVGRASCFGCGLRTPEPAPGRMLALKFSARLLSDHCAATAAVYNEHCTHVCCSCTRWPRLRCSTPRWCGPTARASTGPTPASTTSRCSTCPAPPTRRRASRCGDGGG